MANYSNRELTLQEGIWATRVRSHGDMEAAYLLLCARCIDESKPDYLSMPLSDVLAESQAMEKSLNQGVTARKLLSWRGNDGPAT